MVLVKVVVVEVAVIMVVREGDSSGNGSISSGVLVVVGSGNG